MSCAPAAGRGRRPAVPANYDVARPTGNLHTVTSVGIPLRDLRAEKTSERRSTCRADHADAQSRGLIQYRAMSIDCSTLAAKLKSLLGPSSTDRCLVPFRRAAGREKFAGVTPSSCSSGGWRRKRAASTPSRRITSTVPSAATRTAIDLPADRAPASSNRTLSLMAGSATCGWKKCRRFRACRGPGVHLLRAAGEGDRRARRRDRGRAARTIMRLQEAAAPRRRRLAAPAARPSDVHGAAGGDGPRRRS